MEQIHLWSLMFTLVVHTGWVSSSLHEEHFLKSDNLRNFGHSNSYSNSAKYQANWFQNGFQEKSDPHSKPQVKPISGNIIAEQSFHNSQGKCDSYIDLCGECEGTGRSRVDHCRVCGGDNRCISCDSGQPGRRQDACGNCLEPLSDSWNNCSVIVSVYPRVLDKAASVESVEINVELSRAPQAVSDIQCAISQSGNTINITKYSVEDTWLTLVVSINQLMGVCRLQCSGSHSWGSRNLTVVDSRSLRVTSVSPKTVTLRTPLQFTLVVNGLSDLLDLYCFVLGNQTVASVVPTNQIAGNPMSSTVVCPPVYLQSETAHYVGVAYSRRAVNKM